MIFKGIVTNGCVITTKITARPAHKKNNKTNTRHGRFCLHTGNKRREKRFLMKMADGDHCRSIMFYSETGIDNRRLVPAAHLEQRGDAFVPFFQDDIHNEEEEAESAIDSNAENEEPYLLPWPVLPVEHMDEPEDFLLYDFDDTDDSDDKSSDFEEYDSSDDSDLEVNNDEGNEAGEESKIKQNSFEVGEGSILGVSQKGI